MVECCYAEEKIKPVVPLLLPLKNDFVFKLVFDAPLYVRRISSVFNALQPVSGTSFGTSKFLD